MNSFTGIMKKAKEQVPRKDDDLFLIKKIKKNNCSESFVSLQDRHSNLFYSVCHKFINKLNIEEVYQDKDFVFYKAIASFDDKKGAKFSTWLGNYTRYHCLNYIKKNGKYVNAEDGFVDHFFNQKSYEDYNPDKNTKNDLDHIFNILSNVKDERIVKIFKLRYLDNDKKLTWKQIAAEFNLTPQTIINLHMKGRKILRKKMKNSG